jgi:serine/threonine-protein kinase RsbW
VARLRLRLRPEVSELGRLSEAIRDFALKTNLDPLAALRLTTALDEVVTNVITHGRVPADGRIEVRLVRNGSGVTATVEDGGPAFDPLGEAPPPDLGASVEERPIGGLGLHIVRGLAHELVYARTRAGRNRLRLKLPA